MGGGEGNNIRVPWYIQRIHITKNMFLCVLPPETSYVNVCLTDTLCFRMVYVEMYHNNMIPYDVVVI